MKRWLTCESLWLAVIAFLGAPGYAQTIEGEFEVEIPKRFAGPIQLDDGRLFAIRRPLVGLHSRDGGRTWQEAGPLLSSQGDPIAPSASGMFNIIRLASGAVGVKFDVHQPGSKQPATRLASFFSRSVDEGTTWSKPVQITWDHTASNATWMIQMRTGRLVLPNEYWFTQPGDRGIGICHVFYSDDEGDTWSESTDYMFVWEQGGARQGACEVPCVAETADGKLLIFMRTWQQRLAQSYSDNGGENWSPVALNDLVSGNSEAFLTSIASTGDLLCVWNQASTEEINTGFYRARLTSAISKDNGRTWRHFRTVAMSPGQKTFGQVTTTDPPGFLRTPTPVPKPHQMLADEFHMNRAPRVYFVGDKAYLIYTHRIYRYVNGSRENTYNESKLRVMPTSWFYAED